MSSYRFSRRERALMLVLAILLLGLLWYALVFRETSATLDRLDAEIADLEVELDIASARADELARMRREVARHRAAGDEVATLPEGDGVVAVMAQLQEALAGVRSYSLDFDATSSDAAGDTGAERGVSVSYDSASYADAVRALRSLVEGPCPCTIDSATLSADGAGGGWRTSAHVTFFGEAS